MKLFAIYILIINLIAFVTMFKDKQYAKKHKWRIRESTLFTISFLFGSAGILLGMYFFRHKTKHWKFVIFTPIILIIEIGIIYLIYKNLMI